MSRRNRSGGWSLLVASTLFALAFGCGTREAGEPPSPEGDQSRAAEAAPQTPASTPSTGAAPDPCSLLTAQDIESATGVTPGSGTAAANACSWAAADGSNPRLLNIVVLTGNVTREQWLAGGGTEDEIEEGVGDFAAWVGSQLQVYQGGWLVGVTGRGSDRPEAAQELARAAHARLEG